jgi:hypothetical protein
MIESSLVSSHQELLEAADYALNVLYDNCLSDGREVSKEAKIRAQAKLREAIKKATTHE